jgi:hypothetical protein
MKLWQGWCNHEPRSIHPDRLGNPVVAGDVFDGVAAVTTRQAAWALTIMGVLGLNLANDNPAVTVASMAAITMAVLLLTRWKDAR